MAMAPTWSSWTWPEPCLSDRGSAEIAGAASSRRLRCRWLQAAQTTTARRRDLDVCAQLNNQPLCRLPHNPLTLLIGASVSHPPAPPSRTPNLNAMTRSDLGKAYSSHPPARQSNPLPVTPCSFSRLCRRRNRAVVPPHLSIRRHRRAPQVATTSTAFDWERLWNPRGAMTRWGTKEAHHV